MLRILGLQVFQASEASKVLGSGLFDFRFFTVGFRVKSSGFTVTINLSTPNKVGFR